MKPLVIYVDNSCETITLTKKQFEDYLKQAYDQGYADNNHYYCNNTSGITCRNSTPQPPWDTITVTNCTDNDAITTYRHCAQTATDNATPLKSI